MHLGRHGRSPVRVQREHPGLDALLETGLLDQPPAQARGLPVRHHPARDVAAEDVQNDVEMEVPPLLRPEEPRDVPGPHLVGRAGHDLRLRVVRVAALSPALPDRPVLGQGYGTSSAPSTDRRPRPAASRTLPRGRAVGEARRAQHTEDLRPLRFAQGPGGSRPGPPPPGLRPPATVERGARDPEGLARRAYAHVPGQASGRAQERFPSPGLTPSSPATFPWTSMMMRALRSSSRSRATSRSSFRTFLASRFPPEGLGPRFFASARSDPSRTAFRHADRCEPYSPSRRSNSPVSARRLAGVRLLDDRQLVRRREAAASSPSPKPPDPAGKLPRFACPPPKGGTFRSTSFLLLVPS